MRCSRAQRRRRSLARRRADPRIPVYPAEINGTASGPPSVTIRGGVRFDSADAKGVCGSIIIERRIDQKLTAEI